MRRGAARGAVISKVLLSKKNAVIDKNQSPVHTFDTLGDETVENARELLQLVKARINKRYGYIKLFSLLIFFALYLKSISIQQNVQDHFAIESSIIMSDIMAALPTNGQGGFFNAGGPGATGLLTSSDQLIGWLNQTIIPALFQDAVCGDLVCDADEEPALGRFGCSRDCGRVALSETINVQITLQTTAQLEYEGVLDLRDLNPAFKYNIYRFDIENAVVLMENFDLHFANSYVRNDYIFENPISASNVSISFEALKKDRLELRLYQTKSLVSSMATTQLQSQLRVLASTVPQRSAPTDYSYGDPFEQLAYAYSGVDALQRYCWNCQNRGCNPRTNSDLCTQPFFESTYASVTMLDSYGMSGYVQYSYIDPVTGKAQSKSLLSGGQESVQFCSIFPRDENYYHFTNSFTNYYSSWLTTMKNSETSCDPVISQEQNVSKRRESIWIKGGVNREHLPQSSTAILQNALDGNNVRNFEARSIADLPKRSDEENSDLIAFRVGRRRGAARSETGKESQYLRSAPEKNPLSLALSTVGLDDGSVLLCYDKGQADCFIPPEYGFSVVNWNDSTPDRSDAHGKYRYSGAVYVGVDIVEVAGWEIRYSLDGSLPGCQDPVQESQHTCITGSRPNMFTYNSRAFRYDGKTKIVVHAMSSVSEKTYGWYLEDVDAVSECSTLKVWMCHTALSTPSNISDLNITDALNNIKTIDITQNIYDIDKTVGPLEPGPMVNVNFLVNKELTDVKAASLRLQLCGAVWNLSDGQDMCNWQIWVDIEAGENVEVWSDSYPSAWQSYGNRSSPDVWTVAVTVLMESNSRAARARHFLTKLINTDSFIQAYLVRSTNATVSGDSTFLTNNYQYFAHVTAPWPADKRDEKSIYGCATHYECAQGLFCSYYALKTWDSTQVGFGYGCDSCRTCFDSDVYPIDKSCPLDRCGPRAGTFPKCWDAQKLFAKYSCNDKYPLNMSLVASNNDPSIKSEQVEKTLRARFLTPFNRLIGALVVRQKRLKVLDYTKQNSSQVCNFKNDSFSRYSRTADPSRGMICLDKVGQDAGFYGIDPVFAVVSNLYDGKLNPFDFYNKTEFASPVSPYGFFPHSYDGNQRRDKEPEEVFPEMADDFLLFFDEHITNVRASKMITYLKDGNFIDEQTSEISIEMNTINARNNVICKIVYTFTWQEGGKILWDYVIWSVPIYVYNSPDYAAQIFLEIICLIFLAVNILSELCDETQARFFMTNSTEEAKFLAFSNALDNLGQNLRTYTNMTSVCVILFVLRMLKALDFQPRMALVTRTISTAFSDLFHFIALFSIIFIGYALAGNQLFGHQYEGQVQKLTSIVIALPMSCGAFYCAMLEFQMDHASPSRPIFLIYIWTWVFLAFFVLLNIFLAILIEGYTSVKAGSAHQQGILQEVSTLMWHEIRRIYQYIWGGNFISDDFLAVELAKRLHQTPTTTARALQDYTDIALGNCMKIYTETGKRVNLSQLRNILVELPETKALAQPIKYCANADGGGYRSGQEVTYLDIALMDLMGRYGVIDDRLVGSSKQNSQIERSVQDIDVSQDSKGVLELSLVLERAKEIRSMDVGRGADVFCAAFVDEGDSEGNLNLRGGSSLGSGGRLFQTDVLRGVSEADWTWNQEFKWTLPLLNLNDQCISIDKRQLVILVYDKDQFSSDDVIGCVIIPLCTLRLGTLLDTWLPIIRPITGQGWSWRNFFRTRMLGELPEPELKLKLIIREVVSACMASENSTSEIGSWQIGENDAPEVTLLKGSAKLLPVDT